MDRLLYYIERSINIAMDFTSILIELCYVPAAVGVVLTLAAIKYGIIII